MIVLVRDDFFGDQRLAELRARVGPPDIQSLNVTTLDGQSLTLGELRASAEAFPFLSERRLVVVRKLFGTPSGRGGQDSDTTETRRGRADTDREREFIEYLSQVPDFTDLALVVDRDFRSNHAAVKAVREARGEVHLAEAPVGEDLARWVDERVRARGGRIEASARAELASVSVDDLREMDQTVEMLVTYADGRPITPADVQSMVRRSRESTVFTLVDAVGARDRRGALESLRILLEAGESPIYLLVMLARQVRLLLLANEALARRDDVAEVLKVPPWIARKIIQQARTFDVARCLLAFEQIVRTDASIKTGQAEESIAVEMLVLTLADPYGQSIWRTRQTTVP